MKNIKIVGFNYSDKNSEIPVITEDVFEVLSEEGNGYTCKHKTSFGIFRINISDLNITKFQISTFRVNASLAVDESNFDGAMKKLLEDVSVKTKQAIDLLRNSQTEAIKYL